MSRAAQIIACGAAGIILSLGLCKPALAGDYYIYACSSYANTASAFMPWSDSDHLSTANECAQPAPSGGYRSLEIDNSPNALVSKGKIAEWVAKSPSPAIDVVGAYTPDGTVLVDCHLGRDGFAARYFWSDGKQSIYYTKGCRSGQGYGYGTGIKRSFVRSRYFGWRVGCSLSSTCSTSSSVGAVLGVRGIRLTAYENSGPSIVPDDSNNLWYQTSHWVRGGGWPVDFTARDGSGICKTDLLVNGRATATDKTIDTKRNNASFTQCWARETVTGTLDADSYSNGPLTITYVARNAADVVSSPHQTLHVDNTPVSLVLSAPNDPDPDVWVNHSVRVSASASAGPSGLGGTSCTTNGGLPRSYSPNGITLNGTGVWTVRCSSRNNAFDVNGEPASSPIEIVAVHIDETPPRLAFEPVSPRDPQAVAVAASDAQSGVAGGQIEMRPAGGGSWQSLATQFTGTQLLARFDDAALAPGRWVLQASSCDHAGNCAATQEILRLPLRIGSVLSVGFQKADDRGGRCARQGRRIRRHPHRKQSACRRPHTVLVSQDRVAYGRRARLHGRLTTVQGVPIAGVPVSILTAPENGHGQYNEAVSATTNPHGIWTTILPPGPSRLIVAAYSGSSTIQPVQGWARLTVQASVRVVRVWPRRIPWGGQVHIKARLLGGYLPPDGALVRLRLGYGNAKITYGVKEHVGGTGIFEVTNTFGPGPIGVVRTYWLQECTLPEGDYPFAPACGPRDVVVVG